MVIAKEYPNNLVFGIDIGTRSIVGTLGYKEEEMFYVVAQKVISHKTRAMLDGQIHDIVKVAETIKEIKESLEKKLEIQITDVCIAAAGRVLKTENSQVEIEFQEEKEITQEDVYELESLGVEKAYEEFTNSSTAEEKYFCVGYSVIKYYMNGYPVVNLIGHKVKKIEAELIATFLPNDVVEGLYTAIDLAGLTVVNLTLEPIAAIQVAIPEKFRMLNIALVDVGAGTSDICITKEGSISAYGMLPCAGDALTEVLAQKCLVDFVTADQIKIESTTKSVIEYEDIMCIPQSIEQEAVLSFLDPLIDSMAKQVADKIFELNGDKAVSAVFVIGGGGKIKGYTEKLAEYIGIAKERVALRGEEVMREIKFLDEAIIKDSLIITPIGICMSFYQKNNSFIYTTFNGERVKIYDNGKLTVVDIAMQIAFPKEGLFPKRGPAINYALNGTKKIVRGRLGEAAKIILNGKEADLYTKIMANDKIEVIESTEGDPAYLKMEELLGQSELMKLMINEKQIFLTKYISVNGELKSPYYEVKDEDEIQVLPYYTLRQLISYMELVIHDNEAIYVNNQEATLDTLIYENFTVVCKISDKQQKLLSASFDEEEDYEDDDYEDDDYEDEKLREVYNTLSVDEEDCQKEIHPSDQSTNNRLNYQDIKINEISVIINKALYTLKGKETYVFVDVFDYLDFDLKQRNGIKIITKINGNVAQYLQTLYDGDVIEIFWE